MTIADRVTALQEEIGAACARAGRDPSEVTLVAVSKRHPPGAIAEAYAAGARVFGENYVQEWQSKAEHPSLVGHRDLAWSFIGHLQRNKVRHLIGRVDLIETVDSLRLATAISRKAAGRGARFAQRILLQVNLAGEAGKGGFEPDALRAALPELGALPGLAIEGLMHIPPPRPSAEESRADHRGLRILRDELASPALPLKQLSMGMSGDFAIAVEEGATRVRVGTALFGPRGP